MEQSILKSTKKVLQIGEDDPSFDLDVITHINAAFSTLNDIGVGPELGYYIEDAGTEVWDNFVADPVMQPKVKTYVLLKVRLLFDPPTSQFTLQSMERQLEQLEWRLNVNRETTDWADPAPSVDEDELLDLDGGGA